METKLEQVNQLMQQRAELQEQAIKLGMKAHELRQEVADEMFTDYQNTVFTWEDLDDGECYFFPKRAYLDTDNELKFEGERLSFDKKHNFMERLYGIHLPLKNSGTPISKQQAKDEILKHLSKIAQIRIQEAINEQIR